MSSTPFQTSPSHPSSHRLRPPQDDKESHPGQKIKSTVEEKLEHLRDEVHLPSIS